MAGKELDPHESRLIDTLLQHTLGTNEEQEEDRVRQLMETLRADQEQTGGEPADQWPAGPETQRWSRLRRWMVVPGTTAVILIGLILLPSLISRDQAWATVERSLAAEQEPLVRQYEVTLTTESGTAGDHPYRFDLFVRQRSFVIRAPALTGDGLVWMGGDEDERWIVPRFGPVLTGQQGLLGRWTRRRKALATPFLRTGSILQRLQRFYDLEMQPQKTLDGFAEGDPSVDCDHVVGIRRDSAAAIRVPDRIELWADRELGFARRMEMQWSEPADFAGLTSAVVQLAGTPDISPGFFDHEAHHGPDREVVSGPSGDADADEQ